MPRTQKDVCSDPSGPRTHKKSSCGNKQERHTGRYVSMSGFPLQVMAKQELMQGPRAPARCLPPEQKGAHRSPHVGFLTAFTKEREAMAKVKKLTVTRNFMVDWESSYN